MLLQHNSFKQTFAVFFCPPGWNDDPDYSNNIRRNSDNSDLTLDIGNDGNVERDIDCWTQTL